MKLFSHLMKLLHLMTLPSQQICLRGTLFIVHDTFIKEGLFRFEIFWPKENFFCRIGA